MIAKVLNMLIGLKGNNYYSKVFKRVNYKLSNTTFWVVITNQHWAAPLKDMGNSIILWASSKPWALITVLYSLNWIRGHPIPVYHSISSILNLAGRLAIGSPSKSSHTIPLSDTLNCIILYSSLSMRAWASFEVETTTMAGGGVTSVWLCKVKGLGFATVWPNGGGGDIWLSCGVVWLGGKGGGIVGSYCILSWTGTCWVCCPSILWPRLIIASWIEVIVAMNWSTVTTYEFISFWSDWYETLINLPLTLI